jgi:hypothetical protein
MTLFIHNTSKFLIILDSLLWYKPGFNYEFIHSSQEISQLVFLSNLTPINVYYLEAIFLDFSGSFSFPKWG